MMHAPPGDPLKPGGDASPGKNPLPDFKVDNREQPPLASQVATAVLNALQSGHLLCSWMDVQGLLHTQEERLLRNIQTSIQASIQTSLRSCGSHTEQASPRAAAQGAAPPTRVALVEDSIVRHTGSGPSQASPRSMASQGLAQEKANRLQADPKVQVVGPRSTSAPTLPALAKAGPVESRQSLQTVFKELWPPGPGRNEERRSIGEKPVGEKSVGSARSRRHCSRHWSGLSLPSAQPGPEAASAPPPAKSLAGLMGKKVATGLEPASSSSTSWLAAAFSTQGFDAPPSMKGLEDACAEELFEAGRISSSSRSARVKRLLDKSGLRSPDRDSRRGAGVPGPSRSGQPGGPHALASSAGGRDRAPAPDAVGTRAEDFGGVLPTLIGTSRLLPQQVGSPSTSQDSFRAVTDDSLPMISGYMAERSQDSGSTIRVELAQQSPAPAGLQQALEGGTFSFASSGVDAMPAGVCPPPRALVASVAALSETELQQSFVNIACNSASYFSVVASSRSEDEGESEGEQTGEDISQEDQEVHFERWEWQVASPFWLRLWGIFPTGMVRQDDDDQLSMLACCRKHCRFSTFYQGGVYAIAMGAAGGTVTHSVKAVLASADDESDRSNHCNLLHIADTVMSLGALTGLLLTRRLVHIDVLGNQDSLLLGYARRFGLVPVWRCISRYYTGLHVLAWVLVVVFRMQAQGGIGKLAWEDLNLAAYAFSSGLAIASFQAYLHPTALLSYMVDCFCYQFVAGQKLMQYSPSDWAGHVRDWNLLQATLRRVSTASEWGILVLETTVIMIAFVVGMDALTTAESHNELNWWPLLSLVPLGAVAMMLLHGAAVVSEKCARVPSLVNCSHVGSGLEPRRHFLVEYITYSKAGFHVKEVQITGSMVGKCFYLCFLGAFGLLTRVMAAR